MPDDSWTNLITNACDGVYNGQNLDIKHLTPIISTPSGINILCKLLQL